MSDVRTWTLETVKTQVGVCHKIGPVGSSTKIHHACLYDDCYSNEPRDLQLLADAKLIAAAPDLYEACRAAVEYAENGVNASATLLDYMKLALAKADNG